MKAIDPRRIYVGGEITTGWDLIESAVRQALREQALIREPGRPRSARCRSASTRACAAPPRWSARPPSPRPSWPDAPVQTPLNALKPPSTGMTTPVTNDAASLAQPRDRADSSSGCRTGPWVCGP